MADPFAEAVLRAVGGWLQGAFATLGGALAAAFPFKDLFEELAGSLDPRDRAVLVDRAKGLKLEEVGLTLGLTRERVRQIEERSNEKLMFRFNSLLSDEHPLALALAAHARRLARKIVSAATAEATTLADEHRRRWILAALSGDEAVFLVALHDWAERAVKNEEDYFDPFRGAGLALAGGLTSLPWSDLHLTAIRDALTRLDGDNPVRWTPIDAVVQEAGVTEEMVRALAELARLVVDGRNVFARGRDVATMRRAYLADILSAAHRPMHYAEMAEACLDVGLELDNIHDIQRALSEDPENFATDGNGLWQLRTRFGETVTDQRPDSPSMPVPWDEDTVQKALLAMTPGDAA